MKLYYSPLACSLAARIACLEAGLEPHCVRVDLPTKKTAEGGDLFVDNAMGQVPTLVLDDGSCLTENVAVLAYLSDRADHARGAQRAEAERYELLRWLGLLSTEIHKKVLAPIYSPSAPDAVKDHARAVSARPFEVVAARLASRDVLVGDAFSPADAYLMWALTLAKHAGLPVSEHASLRRFHALHRDRASVRAAFERERAEHETPFAAA